MLLVVNSALFDLDWLAVWNLIIMPRNKGLLHCCLLNCLQIAAANVASTDVVWRNELLLASREKFL